MSGNEHNSLNLLENVDSITVEKYLETYKSRISQDSERLFVKEFLFPLLGSKKIKFVIPQYPFLDSSGRRRRIDFAIKTDDKKIALEVDGETYHAEGAISKIDFDDALQRIAKVASPKNTKRLGKNTPCVAKGECVDCRSDERICNILSIVQFQNDPDRMHVIIVDEDLGY